MTREPDLRVLSLGLGTQSSALALMSAAGTLPRLDAVIFADTQGELPETYVYLEYLRGRLDDARIPLIVVTAGSLEAALLDPMTCPRCTGTGTTLYSNTDDQDEGAAPDLTEPRGCPRCHGRGTVLNAHNPTPPAHVLNPPDAAHPNGSKGRIGEYRCSYDYKRRMVQKETKRLCGGRGDWKRATVEQWIGFSTDETLRMKPDLECRCSHVSAAHVPRSAGCSGKRCRCTGWDPWRYNRWPLIELGMRRGDTIRWFAENGHPTPPRSACWFCPNSGNARWRDLKAKHPDLFERACRLDEHIRDGGAFNARGNQPFAGKMFLHGSTIPLRSADLRSSAEIAADGGQDTLFDEDALAADCDAGTCFT